MIEKIKSIIANSSVETDALIISFALTIVLGFIIIPILKKLKVGQVVRDEGPKEHLSKKGTPTMGGIIMLLTIMVVSFGVSVKYPGVLPVAFITLGYGVIGFIDDFIKLILKNPKGLKPSLKMLGLIFVATAFVVYLTYVDGGVQASMETYIPIFKETISVPTWLYIPFAVFVILACTNSLNLTDGLDGLASGVTAIIMLFFVIVSISLGNKDMAAFSSIVAGTTIAFLFFNMYPARVFMGDTGSLALGGAFCSVALILKMPLILVVVAGVCVIEAISVILQVVYFRVTKGKRLFKMAPIHHHFELCGVKETAIVPAFWSATLILAIISLLII
ncbi:MAG: phospho-N-acetylmuramoyl-pentapeptide-transferase [Clostridia bacterium]|nr:phospho-N-acetylmuramoyl-pentapeptide-transferase [Clostridia bacterium]